MNKEEWSDIPGYEGFYQVSSLGRIKSMRRQGWKKLYLEGHKTRLGYIDVRLSRGGGAGKSYMVHRLVAEAFLPKDNARPEINHKNGLRDDNRLENLERCSRSENMRHSYRVLKRIPPMLGKLGAHRKPVRCVETGEVYSSTCEAGRKTGLRREGIRDSALGRHITCGGFRWEYLMNEGGKK